MNPQMLGMLMKSMGIDMSAITGLSQNVVSLLAKFEASLDRIEQQQKLIMSHLNIPQAMTDEDMSIVNSQVNRLLQGLEHGK